MHQRGLAVRVDKAASLVKLTEFEWVHVHSPNDGTRGIPPPLVASILKSNQLQRPCPWTVLKSVLASHLGPNA